MTHVPPEATTLYKTMNTLPPNRQCGLCASPRGCATDAYLPP